MTDAEIQERKNAIADKTMEIARLDEEKAAFSRGRTDVVKQLKKEIAFISGELRQGVITDRNPKFVGKSE